MVLAAPAPAVAPPVAASDGGCVGAPAGVRLRVDVAGVRDAAGRVVVTVYPDDPRRFLAPGGKLLRARPAAAAPVTTACFELPAAGRYAVVAYHDANGDGRMGRSLLGLPTEGYGFSNGVVATVALPRLEAVRIPVPAGETAARVTLRYPR